jgi:hypothetical protein
MPVIFVNHYTRSIIKKNPETIFVFGDNMIETGLKGQAKEARGEPNSVGIPTKWLPSGEQAAYFLDTHKQAVFPKIINKFAEIREHLANGRNVVFPAAPLGSGYAKLDEKAPEIYKKMNLTVEHLVEKYGTLEPDILKKV